jgi:hypothetical protein
MKLHDFSEKLRKILHDQPEEDVPRIFDSLIQAKDNTIGNLDIIYAHLYAALYYCDQADVDFSEFANDIETMQADIFN